MFGNNFELRECKFWNFAKTDTDFCRPDMLCFAYHAIKTDLLHFFDKTKIT